MTVRRILLALVALMLVAGCTHDTKSGAASPKGTSTTTLSTQAGDSSRIAFMSNRSDYNVFNIWVLSGDGSGARDITNSVNSEGGPDWSPDGSHIAFEQSVPPENQLLVMNADGSDRHRLSSGANDSNPSWDPDGSRIAFDRRPTQNGNAMGTIFVMHADGSDAHPLTTGPESDANPAWSPDGTRIAFQRGPSGKTTLFVMNADGSEQHPLTQGDTADTDAAWSPDGMRIAFTRSTSGGHSQIRVMNADGSNDTEATAASDRVDGAPTWSPDGDRIAFYRQSRNETGDIWTMNVNGSNQVNLTVNSAIDSLPNWTRSPVEKTP